MQCNASPGSEPGPAQWVSRPSTVRVVPALASATSSSTSSTSTSTRMYVTVATVNAPATTSNRIKIPRLLASTNVYNYTVSTVSKASLEPYPGPGTRGTHVRGDGLRCGSCGPNAAQNVLVPG
eukprot:565974-Rhodomonas_salina.1